MSSQTNDRGRDRGCEDDRSPISYDRVALMIEEAMTKHQQEVTAHIDAKFGELTSLIKSAFPEGDPHGHRMSHEAQIKNALFWDRIKASLAEKLAFGVVSGGLVFFAMAGWEWFKTNVVAK